MADSELQVLIHERDAHEICQFVGYRAAKGQYIPWALMELAEVLAPAIGRANE